jgi:hypothetical protein
MARRIHPPTIHPAESGRHLIEIKKSVRVGRFGEWCKRRGLNYNDVRFQMALARSAPRRPKRG